MKKFILILTLIPLFAQAKPAKCVISFADENYNKYVPCDVKPTDSKGSFILTARDYKATIKIKSKNSASLTDNSGKRLQLYKDENNNSCWIEDVWPSTICVTP